MRLIDNFLVAVMTAIVLLASAAPSSAEDVVIYPGYIAGTVAMGDFETYTISTNAVGGSYRSSKYTKNSADYSMTVQGGGWDYAVTASVGIRGDNSTSNVSFNTRTFPVGPNETVPNDYDYDVGVIRFHVNIVGDVYPNWSSSSSAAKAMSPGQEKTATTTYSYSSIAENGFWEMPVVANQQISLSAHVTISEQGYYTRYYSFNDLGTVDVAPGQVIDIPLNIEDYERTILPVGVGGGSTQYHWGTVQGSILLNHIAPKDFLGHQLLAYGNPWRYIYENPGFYEVRISWPYGRFSAPYINTPSTYFPNGYLHWPFPDGNPDNLRVRFTSTTEFGPIADIDWTLDSGIMEGKLKLSGTVNNVDLDELEMQVTSPSIYVIDSTTGRTRREYNATSGGLAKYTKTAPIRDEDYRVYLSAGPWQPSYFKATKHQPGNSGQTITTIHDFEYYSTFGYDRDLNSMYVYGEPVDIRPGETTYLDFDHCVGSLIFRFRDASGATMSRPSLYADARRYNAAGTETEIIVSSYGTNYQNNVLGPEVEVFGPPADYTIKNIAVTAADGSFIVFPNMMQQIECNVTKYLDMPGPDIAVTAPQNDLVTNDASVAVVGSASGATQSAGLTINDQHVPFEANGTTFDYDLALADGTNTITTTVTDATGAQASDERKVYVDRWQPEVSIVAPTAGQLIWFEEAITAMVNASDRGYGYTVSVYLDGILIQQREESTASDTEAVSVNYPVGLGVLAVGDHTLSAEVIDLAGNSVSTSTTFTVFMDRWDPTVEIIAPTDGELFIGCGNAIPLLVNAADQGNGFTLSVSLDGAEIYQLSGGGNLDTPVAVTLNEMLENLSNGSHTIKALATDLAGNSAETTTIITAYEDCSPPTIEIASPLDTAFFAAGIDEIPLNVVAGDQGAGFDLTVYFDGQVIYAADGPLSLDTPVAVSFNDLVGPLTVGSHTVRAVVNDLAGNSATAKATITAYLPADIVAKPESTNTTGGVMTIFVRLPNGLTANASLSLADTAEISAAQAQQPLSVHYGDDEDKLILKFKRISELMGDRSFTVQGRYYPDAENQNKWYYWRGNDMTKK